MAKHPHKLILIDHKVWKCALPGCSFFVYLGLAHVLINKHAICWQCEEVFIVAEWSLKTGKSICDDCRVGKITQAPSSEIDAWIARKTVEARRTEQPIKIVPKHSLVRALLDDEIQEPEHAGDCDVWNGNPCSCGMKQ